MIGRAAIAIALLGLATFAAPAPADAQRKAANEARRNPDAREGALDSYVNPDTDDQTALLKLLQQEIYVNQQKMIGVQYMLEHGERYRLKTLSYNSGGLLIPAHLFTPKQMDMAKKHPAIVMVHGGFHERLDPSWFPLINTLLDEGYVVIFPEYRGSRGYGPDIYENDYGVTDTADVLAAAEFVAGLPYVDPDRLGIYGESRGGMVSLLALEQQPKRFRAAVDVVGLTDFVAYMAYKPEYRRREVAEESPSFGGKLPDTNLPAYMAVSPINAVDRIETPLLVMATTGDKVAPVTLHTGRLLDALKARGKVHESMMYENAPGGHIFMRGESAERYDATRRLVAWYARWLKGAAQ